MSVRRRLLSFVLACASSVIVARAQSQTAPSPEVKKLEVMVGKFTVEDELKAGAMGPNSPAMKFSGTDDCRWTANGFAEIARVTDLVVRMNTDDAEVAATVHFAATRIRESKGNRPTEAEILDYVKQWKIRRRPPLNDSDVALVIRRLNVLSWIDAAPSEALPLPEEAMIA
jgi:hypothetical protein